MAFYKRLSTSALALATIGGSVYVLNSSPSQDNEIPCALKKVVSSKFFAKYRDDNNLITPLLYENYQNKYKFEHFFEKGILKDLGSLGSYNLYIDKNDNDVMNEDIKMPLEQKKEVLSKAKLHCTFIAGSSLQGHNGIIHGGFTSTMFDNVAGYLAFISADLTPALTAYLNMNFKRPMKIDTEYIAVVEVDKIDGRKIYLKGKIIDQENNIYSTMETLYIRMKWDYDYIKYLYKILLLDKKSNKSHIIPETIFTSDTLKTEESQGVAKLV